MTVRFLQLGHHRLILTTPYPMSHSEPPHGGA